MRGHIEASSVLPHAEVPALLRASKHATFHHPQQLLNQHFRNHSLQVVINADLRNALQFIETLNQNPHKFDFVYDWGAV